ncbi:MAG TPA: YihY/virulence factor BrkB family protein [Lacunisphaera sp.]|nr:YihY/virulence factor BrkB family protein [Lacunisphaera sp.]
MAATSTTPAGFEAPLVTGPLRFGLRVASILRRTAVAFLEDDVSRLGAALAFYTTIAVAPLMVLSVSLAGIFLDKTLARETVVQEIQHVIGGPAAEAVASIESPLARPEGITATAIGALTLLFGALGVFRHLQDALNSIWRARPPRLDFWPMVRHRLSSMAIVLATGFLLLVSLILSAALTWAATRALNQLGLPVIYYELGNTGLSFAVITLLFALLFKLLPDTKVPWRHVWLGSVVTAALFTAGKSVLSLYLAHARVTSAYGAAGSLVALLLWCYYASQIVFLGAEFTRVTTLSRGGRDFSALEQPLERVRLAHIPPPGVLNGPGGTGRRRRLFARRKGPG